MVRVVTPYLNIPQIFDEDRSENLKYKQETHSTCWKTIFF